MNVTKTSILTGKTTTLFIEGLTQDMLDSWNNGALIQEALRGIPQELREFVMTGVTPEEWDERIGPEPEEDEGNLGLYFEREDNLLCRLSENEI